MQNLIYELRRLRGNIPEDIRCRVIRRIGCAIHRSFKNKDQVYSFIRACGLMQPPPIVPPATTVMRTKLATYLDKWTASVAYYDPHSKSWEPLPEAVNEMRIRMLTELMQVAGIEQAKIDAFMGYSLSDMDESILQCNEN